MFKHNKKDVHQRNNVARWAIILSIITFVILLLLILSLDLSYLKDFIVFKEALFRTSLVILAALVCILLIRAFVIWMSRSLNQSYLARFTDIPEFAVFEETIWRKYFPPRKTTKYKHAVLLLHGFAASVQEFEYLLPALKEKNIPYFAPYIPGFGRNRAQTLAHVSYNDWLRSAIFDFDMLSEIAEEITIIGHSMGSMLATYLAQKRTVKNLILSGPAMYVDKTNEKFKGFLKTKYISDIYFWLFPYFPKPIRKDRKSCADMMDETHLGRIFQYLSCPTHSLQQLAFLQDHINILEAKAEKLHLIYGKYETTINITRLLNLLDDNKVTYTYKSYPNSAHSVYEDLDHEEAIKDTLSILLQDNQEVQN
jgi:carboxylesterase